MPSLSAEAPRRIPRQARGERRVAQLLESAAATIAANGYDGATMSAIAERAGAPIGSLYQFFPNKQAITHALRTEYGRDFEEWLASLESEAPGLTLDQMVARLIALSIDFVEAHPAFLALLDAPSITRSPEALRTQVRERVACCLIAVRPGTRRTVAVRLATITLQLLKGLNEMYARAGQSEGRHYVGEYKTILSCWLLARLGRGRQGARL